MAKQQTAETLSPLSLVTGAPVAAAGAQRTAALLNYVAGRRPQMHMAFGATTYNGTESPPLALDFPVAGTTASAIVGRCYLHPDVSTVTVSAECVVASAGTTLRVTVRVGGATGVNLNATSANNGSEQTTTVSVASAGTGWQDVEVDLTRVSGAATGYVRFLSVQDTPITTASALADPEDS